MKMVCLTDVICEVIQSGPSLNLRMCYDAVLLVSVKVICQLVSYFHLYLLDQKWFFYNWITCCKTQGELFWKHSKRSVCVNWQRVTWNRYSPDQSRASVADPCSLNIKQEKEKLFHLLCLTIPCLCFPFCHFSITLVLFFGWAGSGAEASPFPSDSHISLFLLVPLESVQTLAKAWGNQPGTTAC